MLLGQDYVSSFLLRAIRLAKQHGFEAEGYYLGEELSCMRSGRPGIRQTQIGREGELALRMRKAKRAVEVIISSPAEIGNAIRRGRDLFASSRPNPLLYNLQPQPLYRPEEINGWQKVPSQFWDSLPTQGNAFRAIRKAQKQTNGWFGSGCFLTGAHEIGVANSAGLLRYFAGHYVGFTVVATGGKRQSELTTYGDAYAKLPQEVDFLGAVDRAFSNARLTDSLPFKDPFGGKNKIRMDAVLSPNCVAEWLAGVATTFSGYQIWTGESYVSDRIRGISRIAGTNITLEDNTRDPRGLPIPFDLEGRTRQRVRFIDHGIYANNLYDGMSAVLTKQKPTGHSGFGLGTDIADSLVLHGQHHTFEDLVKSCDRPALILTWPHYNSELYEKEGMWTATGHHGVFLAKGGRIVAVCPSTRVRLRTFDALKRVELMTNAQPIFDVERYPLTLPSSVVVPWMKIRNVEFVNI